MEQLAADYIDYNENIAYSEEIENKSSCSSDIHIPLDRGQVIR